MRPEGLGNLIKIIHLIGSQTRYLPSVLIFLKSRSKFIYEYCVDGS
jgi:hypothetical protein